MVVVHEGEDAIHDGMIRMHEARRDPEEDMDDGVDELMQLGFQERANGRLPRRCLLAAWPTAQLGRIGEVWLQEFLSLGRGELGSPGTDVSSKEFSFALGDHGWN